MVSLTQTKKVGSITIEILLAFALFMTAISGVFQILSATEYMRRVTPLIIEYMAEADTLLTKTYIHLPTQWHHRELLHENIAVRDISHCLVEIHTTQSFGSILKPRTLRTLVASVDESHAHGHACEEQPRTHPPVGLTTHAHLSVSQVSGTTLARTRIHDGRTLLILGSRSTDPDAEDVHIFDITDISHATHISSFHVGSGVADLVVVSDYVYLLPERNDLQLAVLDIRTPETPVLVGEVSLPNISTSCSPIENPCRAGRTIAHYNGALYIGTRYMAFGATALHNNEFHIFCIDSTIDSSCLPTTPHWRGSLNVNHNINDIVVHGTTAYLATSDNAGELHIVDIGDHTNLTHADISEMKFDARTTGNGDSTEDGVRVFALGEKIFLGRTRVNASNEKDFYILDGTELKHMSEYASLKIQHSVGSTIRGIDAHDTVVLVTSNDPTHYLSVFDITNISSPQQLSLCGIESLPKPDTFLYHFPYVFIFGEEQLRILEDNPVCIH